MIKLIISDVLTSQLIKQAEEASLIATRKLSVGEVALVKKYNLKRFYLPNLTKAQKQNYFGLFNQFWNQAIFAFDIKHPFWRHAVSSKMQEWEASVGYLTQILFALTTLDAKKECRILVIVNHVKEVNVWEKWASLHQWKVEKTLTQFQKKIKTFTQELLNVFKNIAYGLRFFRYKLNTPSCQKAGFTGDQPFDVLVASLFYPRSFQEKVYRDPFFDDLHNYMEEVGKKSLYIAHSLIPYDKNIKRKLSQRSDTVVVSPLSLVSWGMLIKIIVRNMFSRISFSSCQFKGCSLTDLMSWNGRRNYMGWNLEAEIYYQAVKVIGERAGLEQLLVLLEGNVFERACIQAFREISKGKVVGYAHGVIYPKNLKLFISSKESEKRPEPDHIVCTGDLSKEKYMKVRMHNQSTIVSGCALRNIPHQPGKAKKRNQVLIALDGVYDTVNVLDWLIDNRDIFSSFHVCVRNHPNVSINELQKLSFNHWPEEFHVSSSTLEEDLMNSFCVIYRSTSIGLQALLNGIPVIHLAIDAPINADPIDEVKKGKWQVDSKSELIRALQIIQNLPKENNQEFIGNTQRFVASYFSKRKKETLSQFMAD